MHRRAPATEIPTEECHHGAINDVLDGDAPIGKAVPCQRHARHARSEEGRERHPGRFFHAQISEEHGTRRGAPTCKHEVEERESRQRHEFWLVEKISNERRTEKQDDVEHGATENIKPEDRVIVFLRDVFLAVERRDKTALLQGARQEREDGEHAHHAIVGRREQAAQKYAKHEVEHLLSAVVDAAPKNSFGGFFF